MAKITQKKKNQTRLSKRKIFLIVVSLLTILLGVFVSVKIYEKNRAIEDKKNLLDRSFEATLGVYEEFSNQAPAPKEKDKPTRGRCSSAGKYSTLYTCGPEAQVTVTNLDESQYRSLNDLALNMYRDSGYFERIGSTEPRNNGLDPGLTGTAGSRLSGSDMRCYYSSNYNYDKRTATFAWGCKLKINDKYYSTGY